MSCKKWNAIENNKNKPKYNETPQAWDGAGLFYSPGPHTA